MNELINNFNNINFECNNDIIRLDIFYYYSYNMSLREISKAKRNTLQIYATLDKYQTYKRSIAATQGLYENDLLCYNDSIEERHERNKKQIKKILSALRQKKITPQMIQYNTTNTFYPSYVLNHHFNQFTRFVEGLSDFYHPLNQILPQLKEGTAIGAVFDRMINTNFQKQTKVELTGGVLRMPADSYFYSFKTSPYIHICCFQHKENNKNLYIFVQIRNESSQFCKGVEVRDLGATLSTDYLAVAYRFDNVKPVFIVEANTGKLYRNIISYDSVVQLGYSLQDLANSLYVTVKYTSMRLQFATLQKSKAERPIGQYQAVTSRIADGFATLFGLSFLRQRLITMPQVSNFMRFYLPFMHQVILERLIDLRQCCGGFGYLQMSGHPGFLQRTSVRAAQPTLTIVPQNKQIMKRVHYYSNDDDREKAYLNEVSEKGDKGSDIFYYFVVICIRMRQNREKMNSREYMKQFLRQSCIQMMYSSTYFDSVDQTNPTQNLLPFIITKYVLQFSKFLNWPLMKKEPEKFHELLINKKTELLNKIAPEIPKLTQIMEIGNLRNIIVGCQNSNEFYKKVMEASEKNKRNSPEYKEHVLKNLVSLIKEQRANL